MPQRQQLILEKEAVIFISSAHISPVQPTEALVMLFSAIQGGDYSLLFRKQKKSFYIYIHKHNSASMA